MDKKDEKRVREIAREEALKCIQGVLAQKAAFVLRWLHDDEPEKTKKRQLV